MSNEQNNQNQDMEFEQMMEQRIRDNLLPPMQAMSKSLMSVSRDEQETPELEPEPPIAS